MLNCFLEVKRLDLTHDLFNQLENLPMTDSNLNLDKNSDNKISFNIRDFDRRPINLIDCRVQLKIIDPITNIILKTIEGFVEQEREGRGYLLIRPIEFLDLANGNYQYILTLIDENGISYNLKINRSSSYYGTLTIQGFYDIAQNLDRTVKFYPKPDITIENSPEWLISDVLKGNAFFENYSFNTVVLILENFTGEMEFQFSVEPSVPPESNWFNLPIDGNNKILFNSRSGSVMFNLEQYIKWFRVKFIQTTGILKEVQLLSN